MLVRVDMKGMVYYVTRGAGQDTMGLDLFAGELVLAAGEMMGLCATTAEDGPEDLTIRVVPGTTSAV